MHIVYKHKKFLFFLFIFSCAIRLFFFTHILECGKKSWIVFDSAQYDEIAHQIATKGSILQKDGTPNFYRLPGYPIFLGSLYKIYKNDRTRALATQVIINSIVPVLIFLLTLTLCPWFPLGAHIAGILASIHLGFIMYAGTIATETLFLIFFLLFLILLYTRTRSYKRLFIAGLVLGIASLVRPVGHYVILLIPFIYAPSRTIANLLKDTCTISLGWAIAVLPWLIRNFLLTGYIFFHTLPGIHFLQYTSTQVYMHTHACSYLEARTALLKEWDLQVYTQEAKTRTRLNDIERCYIAEQITKNYINHAPLIVGKHALVQILKTVFGLHASHLLYIDQGWQDYTEKTTLFDKVMLYVYPHTSSPVITGLIYFDILMLLFLLTGCLLFLIRIFYDKIFFALAVKTVPFIGLFIGLTLAYGNARLRMPIEPLLIILALIGWQIFFREKHD